MHTRLWGIVFCLLTAGITLAAQPRSAATALMEAGDSLHRTYHFEEALARYLSIPGASLTPQQQKDLDRRITQSQNALNMTDFCAMPHVVARQRFSRKDFFLFYPAKSQSWHPTPNVLDSLGGYPVFFPKGETTIYYSAPDRGGSRSIFVTEDLDSLWRAPQLLGESLVSPGSDIFPMLSPDGQTLYFASDGLYGMGGFDLYASAWDDDTHSWGDPVNLGFPFSSPADDFLMMVTDDGEYTLFASNRDCSADSVYVYVLDYEPEPQRKAIHHPGDLARLASLREVKDLTRIDNESVMTDNAPDNANTRLYKRKMDEARTLRDSVYQHEKGLDELRSRLARASEQETAALTARIREREAALQPLRRLLEETNLEIRLIEQSFLRSGVVSASENDDRELVGADRSYTFAKRAWGGKLRMKVATPRPNRSFRRMPVGRFAQDNTLPAGLVYQIQLFTSSRHATLEEIAGLSPVYERLSANLRYTYSVGVFPTYREALAELNTVRLLGFPDARIIAFRDGRPIPIRTARAQE